MVLPFQRWPGWLAALLLSALIAGPGTHGLAQDAEKKPLVLPKSPVAAAYLLSRLSNKELAEAPRSEFVYVALLQRAGLERKYRVEALEGLAKARASDPIAELVRGISELARKGEGSLPVLTELASLLVQKSAADLTPKRAQLESLAAEGALPLARQAGYAALITADAGVEKLWPAAESDPAKFADLLHSMPLVRPAALSADVYGKLRPLIDQSAQAEVRRGAIAALASTPGHEEESFKTLASLAKAGTERGVAVASLQRIPRKNWPKAEASALLASLMSYLKELPADQRTSADALSAYQLATDLVPMLPADQTKDAAKALRGVGVSVFVIRTIREQMLYDKTLLVVEAGKPVEIILVNEDAMTHNLVIVQPGAAEEVGKGAEKMTPVPDEHGRVHVPASPKVLYATKMLESGQQAKLSFTAPADPGDYPYICTFPGHWMRMMGTLAVVKDVEAYLASRPATPTPIATEWKVEDFSGDWTKVGSARNLAGGHESFTKLGCIQCHKLGSEGYAFGPDLTEVFQRMKGDHAAVLTEMLEPSKVIGDRYRNFAFELKDGDEFTGLVVKEEGDTVWIQTGPADALIKSVKKADIKARESQSTSLMPMGLLTLLSKDQVLDLLAYVETGGKMPAHQHGH